MKINYKKLLLWFIVLILIYSGIKIITLGINLGVSGSNDYSIINLIKNKSAGVACALTKPWFANAISTLSFLVLAITLIAIWQQLRMQTKTFKSQLVNAQFQQYWRLIDPITDDQIREIKIYPDDYMDINTYKAKYEGDEEQQHKYIWMMQNYEYLAYCYSAFNNLKIKQTGVDVDVWLDELMKENVFIDVHNANGKFYPAFSQMVQKRIDAK